MSGSLLAFFHLCMVSVPFSAPSILKWNKVWEKLFSLVSILFRGFSKSSSKQMTNALIVLQTNTLARGEDRILRNSAKRNFLVYYSDDRLVLETNALKAHVPTSGSHSYTCSYQRFSSRHYLKIATHRHSPSQTSNSHTLILTCEYAPPTSYIHNSVLCWTKWLSSWLSW